LNKSLANGCVASHHAEHQKRAGRTIAVPGGSWGRPELGLC
jgi:hypothetical protein